MQMLSFPLSTLYGARRILLTTLLLGIKQARNLEQKREWALQLKRVILENYDAVIPHHARQLVLQLGQERCSQERPSSNNQSSERDAHNTSASSAAVKRHQHSAPEYLERRKHSTAGLTAKTRIRKGRKSSDGSSPREVMKHHFVYKILTDNLLIDSIYL